MSEKTVDDRKAFETWISAPPFFMNPSDHGGIGAWDADKYPDRSMQLAWEAWQESASRLTAQQPIAQEAASGPVAVAHIRKKADKYAQENCSVDPDDGSTIYHYGQAGMEYHNGLLELADELESLAPPAQQEGAGDVRDARRYQWLRRKAAIISAPGILGNAETRNIKFEFVNLPYPTHVAPRPDIELDYAIDEEMNLASPGAQGGG